MKVVLDNIIFSLQQAGGISGMWANLIRHFLLKQELDITFIEYPGAQNNIFRKELNIPDNKIILQDFRLHKNLERFLPLNYEMSQKHIFHSSYYRVSKNPFARTVTTVHDFTYEKVKVTTRMASFLHSFQKRSALRHSDAIVCVSENTWNDFKSLYPALKRNKIIIGNAPICEPKPSVMLACQDDFLLYVGDRHSYKNFRLSIDVSAQVGKKLVICGAPLTNSETRILTHKLGSERWLSYRYPDQMLLSELYNSAFCLLYLSSYEGFGIPILEAQQHRCPVIAISGSSINEVAGSSYQLISKDDSLESLSNLILKLENEQFREDVINSGIENCKRFSWRDIATAYHRLYQELLQ